VFLISAWQKSVRRKWFVLAVYQFWKGISAGPALRYFTWFIEAGGYVGCQFHTVKIPYVGDKTTEAELICYPPLVWVVNSTVWNRVHTKVACRPLEVAHLSIRKSLNEPEINRHSSWGGRLRLYSDVANQRLRKIDHDTGTGWPRPIWCLKLQVMFHKRATKNRALLRKMTCKDKASYGSSPPCIMIQSGEDP